MREIPPNGYPEKALNFLTPHQKWGIHSTYSENLLMQTLSRGGPIVWISETDARELGIEDNDWIEAFNANGALTARAVVSQRVPPGMTMMYHAQERILNIPGSEVTGRRGGIHNSVTRVCPKPTHMIRRLRAAGVQLQLLRHRRLEPRRVHHDPQNEKH